MRFSCCISKVSIFKSGFLTSLRDLRWEQQNEGTIGRNCDKNWKHDLILLSAMLGSCLNAARIPTSLQQRAIDILKFAFEYLASVSDRPDPPTGAQPEQGDPGANTSRKNHQIHCKIQCKSGWGWLSVLWRESANFSNGEKTAPRNILCQASLFGIFFEYVRLQLHRNEGFPKPDRLSCRNQKLS